MPSARAPCWRATASTCSTRRRSALRLRQRPGLEPLGYHGAGPAADRQFEQRKPMKILILGAGQVGSSVAAALATEKNDITVVDTDHQKLRELAEKLDIRTVVGHASLPSVLAQAGAEDAGLLVAVTSSDEVNLVACQVVEKLYGKTTTRVARLREAEYLEIATSVDAAISPEQLVCKHIQRLIEYPGALQVLDFAEGRAQLVGVRAVREGALVGHEIRELRQHLPSNVDARVAAIFRAGKPIKPE